VIEVNTENAAAAAQAVKTGAHLQPAKSLAEALARIYSDGARYVQKTGQMQGFAKYSYARETDFIAALRPLLELHGVTIRPVQYEVLTNESFDRGGKVAYRVVVLATFEFLHSSGDKATAQAIGEGQDSGDKAFNKAMTGAMKYVLRQSFCTETGDDPDDTPSHEQDRAAHKPGQQTTQPPRQQPKPAPAPPTPKYAARDNMPLRARHSQALAQAANKPDVDATAARIGDDVKNGMLSEGDVQSLRGALEEARKRVGAVK
jgi:hypothetical protein